MSRNQETGTGLKVLVAALFGVGMASTVACAFGIACAVVYIAGNALLPLFGVAHMSWIQSVAAVVLLGVLKAGLARK